MRRGGTSAVGGDARELALSHTTAMYLLAG